jgi:hypothetical protein
MKELKNYFEAIYQNTKQMQLKREAQIEAKFN